jgi:alanine dehydrogenase
MNIGIPKERRAFEYRVGLFPAGVKMLTHMGHTVYVEHEAGLGAGFSDQEYIQSGARIAYTPHEVFGRADLLLKVTRPLAEEIEWLRPGVAMAGLLHLGSSRKDKVELLVKNEITAIAYEQIMLADGSGPIRKPLSRIGGILTAQVGANLLQSDTGGKGILLGGMPGVPPAEVVIIGAGVAGTGAAKAFKGMGAHLTVLDTNINALEEMCNTIPNVATLISNPINIERCCAYADLVIGAILVPGELPPIVVTREMVRAMKPRSVIMDISIDEGGCVETSRPTTNDKPTFIEENVVHYCVPNMGSLVSRTATYAFLNAAMPFILELVTKGIDKAIAENPAIERGVSTYRGKVTHISSLTPLAQME